MEDYTPGEPLPETAGITILLKAPPLAQPMREVKYEVLCSKCMQAVVNYVDSIDLDPEARKKPRAKKGEEAAEAAPKGEEAAEAASIEITVDSTQRSRPSSGPADGQASRRTPRSSDSRST
jgi:hypothetical protein